MTNTIEEQFQYCQNLVSSPPSTAVTRNIDLRQAISNQLAALKKEQGEYFLDNLDFGASFGIGMGSIEFLTEYYEGDSWYMLFAAFDDENKIDSFWRITRSYTSYEDETYLSVDQILPEFRLSISFTENLSRTPLRSRRG